MPKLNVVAGIIDKVADRIDDFTLDKAEKAEMLNGRVAMIGVISALGAYAATGQIIPGLW